jgi:hypothetical protein
LDGALRALVPLLHLALAGTAAARTWIVTPDQTGDAPTIEAAMDSAAAGDSVVVECGTYVVEGIVLKSDVTLTGASGQADCVSIYYEGVVGGPLSPIVARGIQGGTVEGFTFDGLNRGGYLVVRCDSSAVSLRACRFTDWWEEHVKVHAEGSDLVVEDCVFERNGDPGYGGGGIALLSGSTAEVRRCTFRDNAGAILSSGAAALTVEDSIFEANKRFGTGGGKERDGSAILCAERAVIRDCDFVDNAVDGRGTVAGGGTVEITGCSFRSNYGRIGAGVCVSGELMMRNCVFQGNRGGQGAGLALLGGSAIIEDCLITGNTGNNIGAAFFDGMHPLVLRRCTIAENTGINIQAIAGPVFKASTVVLEQSIVLNACGVSDMRLTWGTTVTSRCSIVDHERMNTNGGVFIDDGGTLDADPLFCAAIPCGEASIDGDYAVAANSPCLPPNNSCGVQIGVLGAGCATTGLETTTWGEIKSRYRTGS